MKKKVFIFGVTGQDGCYLAKLLLDKKFKIFGFSRSLNQKNLVNLEKLNIKNKITLHKYSNFANVKNLLIKKKPQQIYYLAGQSSVFKSFSNPIEAYYSNIVFLFTLLEFCRKKKLLTNIYNSASTECFGLNKKICNEKTNFNPLSPYARSKAFSFWLVKYYRENFGVRSCSGILSNHESILRKNSFIIKKISKYVQYFNGKKKLKIGGIAISRDWGWAQDYVEAIYKINSSYNPDDYVVATGKNTLLTTVIKKFFKKKNISLKFLEHNNKKFLRSSEAKCINCSISKIKKKLNWKPKNNINQIINKIYNNELF